MVVYRKVPLEKVVGECRTVINGTLLEGNGAEGRQGVLEGAGRHSTLFCRRVLVQMVWKCAESCQTVPSGTLSEGASAEGYGGGQDGIQWYAAG